MSAPIRNAINDRLLRTPTMYAPPWAREEAREAGTRAADQALAASEELRRVLPPAPLLTEPRTRRREPPPFEGDLAAVRLRERPSLDPVTVPPPPLRERGSTTGMLVARIASAVGLAALAALLMVGTMPLKGAVKAESESALPAPWSRFGGVATPPQAEAQQAVEQPAALADRFAATQVAAAQPAEAPASPPPPVRAVPTVPMQTAAALAEGAQAQIARRSLGADEVAGLYRRSRELIVQGDIAAARLLLTRAAEAGDARSALALAVTYDAVALRKLGVLGVAADATVARAWYARAAEFGSEEAARRLEQPAQASR